MPNGIAVDRFDPTRPRQNRVLAVTRMLERKGVQYLIEALAGSIVPSRCTWSAMVPTCRRCAGWLRRADSGRVPRCPGEREPRTPRAVRRRGSSPCHPPWRTFHGPARGDGRRVWILTTAGTGCAEAVGDCAELVAAADIGATRAALARLIADPVHAAQWARPGAAHREPLRARSSGSPLRRANRYRRPLRARPGTSASPCHALRPARHGRLGDRTTLGRAATGIPEGGASMLPNMSSSAPPSRERRPCALSGPAPGGVHVPGPGAELLRVPGGLPDFAGPDLPGAARGCAGGCCRSATPFGRRRPGL